MQRVREADWAAQVPWNGIQGKPDLTLPNLGISGVGYVYFDGSKFSTTDVSGGGGSAIADDALPGEAVRRLKQGSTGFEQIWARYVANIAQYGVGGGDSSAAFNLAIADITKAGGGTIYVPAGDWTAFNLDLIQVPCLIRGDGIGVSNVNGANSDVFSFYGTSFGFEGISVCRARTALYAENCSLYVDRASLQSSVYGINLVNAQGGHVTDSYFVSAGTGSIAAYGSANNLRFSGLSLLAGTNFSYGVYLTAGTANVIDGMYANGVTNAEVYLGSGVKNTRVKNVAGANILSSEMVVNVGTGNYVNDLYGLGGNTDTRWNARKEVFRQLTWVPGSVPAGYGYYQDFTFQGAAAGDQVILGRPSTLDPWTRVEAFPIGNDSLRISLLNIGTASIYVGTGVWPIRLFN